MTGSQALGKNLAELFTLTGHPLSSHPVTKALRENVVAPFTTDAGLVVSQGNVTPISGSAAPIRDDGDNVTGVVLTFRDISERKKSEQDLAEAVDQARESDRLKSQLLSTVSHELHTPLSSINGFATTLRDNEDTLDQSAKR